VVAGAALGLAITIADAELAGAGRQTARDWIAPRMRAGERVWFAGGWGAQWYALQAGALPLAHQPPFPAPGDIVVKSRATPGPKLEVSRLDSLAGRTWTSRYGRIMAAEAGAGFYSNLWGVLPWTPSNGPIEGVSVWRVR
jgi:hypothetical protein